MSRRILTQAITPSSKLHKLLPNIQSVLATQCLSFWHFCVGLAIRVHSSEALCMTAQKIPKLDANNKAAMFLQRGVEADENLFFG